MDAIKVEEGRVEYALPLTNFFVGHERRYIGSLVYSSQFNSHLGLLFVDSLYVCAKTRVYTTRREEEKEEK